MGWLAGQMDRLTEGHLGLLLQPGLGRGVCWWGCYVGMGVAGMTAASGDTLTERSVLHDCQ